MMQCYAILGLLLILLQVAASADITLTFIYQQTSLLSCEKANSDSSVVWLKDGNAMDTSADPNITITDTGSLVFEMFEFGDTGQYHCQDTDVTYIVIIDCPSDSQPNFLSDQCICSPGAMSNVTSASLQCDLCEFGLYKPHPGNHACFQCPTSRVTEREGSIAETSCVCPPGHGISNSLCVPCPADTYQDKYEEVACIDCPRYSATPQPLGESDAEAFSSRSDCVCAYSPDNADNATCWPFHTTSNVTMVQIEATTAIISWTTDSLARADNGAFRGIIAGYHLEVIEDNELNSNAFTHNYSPSDYTPEDDLVVEVQNLKPDTTYTIAVNAFTKSTEIEDGPPTLLTITTTLLPTTTGGATTPTPTPNIFVSTAITTSSTTTTTSTTTVHTDTTTQPTVTHTKPTVPTTKSTTGTTTQTDTTLAATPKVVIKDDSTASAFLAVLVVLLALFITVLLVLIALRYLRNRRRHSTKLRYAHKSEDPDRMKRIRAQPQYPVYGNAVYLNNDASDSLI